MSQSAYKKSLKYFFIFTFPFTYGSGFFIYFYSGLEESPTISTLLMLIPSLISIIIIITIEKHKRISKISKAIGFRIGKLKYMIIFPVTTFTVIILTYLITYLMFPDVFYTSSGTSEVLNEINIELGFTSIFTQSIIIFVLNCILGSVINLPIYLGEEIGWRAFLYPRLEKLYKINGIILGGVIWGIWHAPVILMGHNYPDTPVLGLFIMILFCIPVGCILYYIYVKSGSIITVALSHGVINQTSSTIHMLFIDETLIEPTLHGPTGLVGIIIFTLIAFLIFKQLRIRQL